MSEKTLSLFLLSILLLAAYTPTAFAHGDGAPDPNTLVIDSISEPETLDPAWSYDTASGAVIQQVYENLIFFKIDWTAGLYQAGKTDSFDPMLATSVPHLEYTGLPPGKVQKMTFTIRSGPTFSDGNPVTALDVEYSFERMMVQDRDGGPQWMIYYPLLGIYSASDPNTDPYFGDKINNAVVSSGNNVTFYFNIAFPEMAWLQILAQHWSGIVEKSWAVGLGDFDGIWVHSWSYIYSSWHNPPSSFVEDHMMGSGPYKLNFWTHGVAYSVRRNPNYWQGWPAPMNPGSSERISGYIETVVWNLLFSWSSLRRPRFLSGVSDMTDVDRQYRDQVIGQPGIRCYYPLTELSGIAMFFTFNIRDKGFRISPYADWNIPDVFTETGCPPNIFNDTNVRKGFASAFDYNSWLTAAYLGEATQPSDPIIQGIAYDNPAEEKYEFNMTKAKEYLQKAWGGALWANGMTFTIPYTVGSVPTLSAAQIMANSINSLNPKFHLKTIGVPWGSTYLPQMVNSEIPIFIIGWQADYPDPDNFAFPFMHSQGTFAAWQKYKNLHVDALIENGITTPDETPAQTAAYNAAGKPLDLANPIPAMIPGPPAIPPDTRWPRRSIYYELQRIYFEDAPSIMLAQPLGRHFERDWMRGWYYNPIMAGMDAYHMWKAKTHFGDANNDGHVNVADLAFVSAHWTAAGLPYNPSADINGGKGCLTGNQYIPGMPDGVVDITDVGLIAAYWDGP